MRLRPLILGAALSLSAAASTNAALKITEVMSSSGSGGTPDWFELTNLGALSENVTGYRMDDNSFAFANSVLLNGITTISPGESVVFFESTSGNPAAEIASYQTFWGGTALTAQIGYFLGSGAGVSLSSSGDGVIVYDSVAAIINQVSFPAATAGVSFGYDPIADVFGGLSQVGVNGAYNSDDTTPQNVGSPGAIPEPASLGLLGLVSMLTLARRTRRA